MLLSIIIACSQHESDKAVAAVEFVGATADCGEGLVVTAGVTEPDLDGIAIALTAEGPDGVIGADSSTVQGGSLSWHFVDPDLSDGDSIVLTLSGKRDERTDTLEVSVDGVQLYIDADLDGYGSAIVDVGRCEPGEGWSDRNDDCDDTDSTTHPNAAELCDEIDHNCNGPLRDHPIDETRWYTDHDGDDFGDPEAFVVAACERPHLGLVGNSDDCDDTDAHVNPGVAELCNGIDDDCDDLYDDADTAVTYPPFYPDADDDGYATPGGLATTGTACEPPSGQTLDPTEDCDDSNPLIHPHALEFCDDIDHDCDHDATTNDPDTIGAIVAYRDDDGDGFGVSPDGTVCPDHIEPDQATVGGDCDDNNPSRHPGAYERCNTSDDDCDPSTPEQGVLWNDQDFPGLVEAIDAVAAADRDILEVLSVCGVLNTTDEIVVPHGMRLQLGGIDEPEIRGPATLHGSIAGFGLRWTADGARAHGVAGDRKARMALISETGSLTLYDSEIDCASGTGTVDEGGAIHSSGGSLRLFRSSVSNCSASGDGGAIHLENAAWTAEDVLLEANTAGGDGGAVHVTHTSGGGISERRISAIGNHAGHRGGAIAAFGLMADMELTGMVLGNTAAEGGVAYIEDGRDLVIGSATISGNHATGNGGVAALRDTHLQLDSSVVSGNSAGLSGGAFHLTNGEISTVQHGHHPPTETPFISNVAGEDGGAILLDTNASTCVELDHPLRFQNNVATDAGGALAVVATGPCSISSTDTLIFESNQAAVGAALAISGSGTADIQLGTTVVNGNQTSDASSGQLSMAMFGTIDCTSCSFGSSGAPPNIGSSVDLFTNGSPLDFEGSQGVLSCIDHPTGPSGSCDLH